MASFASADKDIHDLYRLLNSCIVPRPIGWVATRGADGTANLAPFSFFNAVCRNPPTVAFSIGDRPEGRKDTSANLEAHPEFIVHIVSEALAEQMNVTCGEYGIHVDEFAEAGLRGVPGSVVDVQRVADAAVAMECRVTHHLRIGRGEPGSSHVLGEVLHWHVADHVLSDNPRYPVNPAALQAVGRMGGIEYTRTQDRFSLERPVVPPDDPRAIRAPGSPTRRS